MLATADECPPLAPAAARLRQWTFAERYPALVYVVRSDPRLLRQLEHHYARVLVFCEQHVEPQALALDRRLHTEPDYVPHDLIKAAAEFGLFSMIMPGWMGGGGQHFIAAFITYEVIATYCVGIANLLGVNGLAIGCVMSTFDPRALREIANRICDNEREGRATFFSTCVTEPGAGSDAEDADEFEHAKLATTALPVEGGYRLNGTKVFISNGSLAELHVVAAYTDVRHRPQDMGLFLVPSDSRGVRVARNEKKLGQKVCPASEIVFEDVFVPDTMACRTAGGEGSEFSRVGLANVLGMTRAGVGAFAAGVAEGAYRVALQQVRRQSWMGAPMETQQWVRSELAALARRAQLARAAYMDALLAVCEMGMLQFLDGPANPPMPRWLARQKSVRRYRDQLLGSNLADRAFKLMAARQTEVQRNTACALGDAVKVSATDLALENCQRAMTLIGKNSLRHDSGAEKLLRDAKLLQIYEGTNQVNTLDFIKRRVSPQLAGG